MNLENILKVYEYDNDEEKLLSNLRQIISNKKNIIIVNEKKIFITYNFLYL